MGIMDDEQQIGLDLREWITATDIASDDSTRTWQWGTGRKPLTIRLILLALGHTALCTRSAVVSTDPDQLALLSGTTPEAAATAVQALLHDNDPLIVPAPWPAPSAASACWLRIPKNYRQAAKWLRRRAGRLTPAHPVFLVLGPAAGFTYSSLDSAWLATSDIVRETRLSYATASKSLKNLQDHGLAVAEIARPSRWDRRVRCWRRGPAAPDDVAQEVGASRLYEHRFLKHSGDPGAVRWPYSPEPVYPDAFAEMAP